MWVDYKPVDVEMDDDIQGFVFEMQSEMNEFDLNLIQGSNPCSSLNFLGLSRCCLSSTKMR